MKICWARKLSDTKGVRTDGRAEYVSHVTSGTRVEVRLNGCGANTKRGFINYLRSQSLSHAHVRRFLLLPVRFCLLARCGFPPGRIVLQGEKGKIKERVLSVNPLMEVSVKQKNLL